MLVTTSRASISRTAMWVGIYLIAQFAVKILLLALVPHGAPANQQALAQIEQELSPAGLLFVGTVIGPCIEEVLFRLCLYNVVRICVSFVLRRAIPVERAATIGAWIGIVVSASFFAAAHLEQYVALFLAHFVMGIATGHLYYRTGRLGAPAALHMSNNLVAFGALVL